MHCRHCQRVNREDARYCAGCGGALGLRCAVCQKDNAVDAGFCDGCGAALPGPAQSTDAQRAPQGYTPAHLAQKILTLRSALEGERKQVTVLFCDIANSTALAQRLGAEAMHRLLNQFFELALQEVHRVEGTVNQFLGDGFMALFGAPLAHEDHVRRALMAALGIRTRLAEAAAGDNAAFAQISLRMGLNSGAVVVGKIGDNLRMDYTAVGNTTNLAARLQSLAQPGRICVSDAVQAVGQRHFDFVSIGRHALKGIAEPVSVFELTRAHSRADDDAQGERLGIGSDLVGRDEEIATLHAFIARLHEGQGGVLILSGEPGTGKSRLVAETRRHSGGSDLQWLEGRAVSFGRSLSYWPFIEVLRECFGIEDDDGEDLIWRKLQQGLERIVGERAGEMLPYIATVLKLRLPPEHEERLKYLDSQGVGRQVFLCMRQLFEQLASRQPVLLLLEDWHWADKSSIQLAEHLLPLTASTSLLMLFASRPEPQANTEAIRLALAAGPAMGRLHEIALTPLSEVHSRTLIDNLVGASGLPDALGQQILRRTEGNPFFIEEVVRSLLTDGVLARDERSGSLRLVKQVDQIHLPETIQGLILARIDRLDDEVKQVLKLASVIGRSFFNRVLEAISDAQRDLKASLDELEHAELVRQRQVTPELEYIFKHALVQEAAYGSILAESRRGVHRQVARAIESLFSDRLEEFTTLLAYHYTLAEEWDKAQEYLFKAGDQAGRMAADTEALEHFSQAEAAYSKAFGDQLGGVQRAALARKTGTALFGTGQYERGHEQMRRALSQLGIHYPTSAWGVRGAFVKHLASHAWRRTRNRFGRPVRRVMDVDAAVEISTICHFMAWMDYFLDKERILLDSVLELRVGETSSHALAEARGLSSLGFGFMTFGLRGLARRYHLRANAVAQHSNDRSAIAFAIFALGFLDFFEGQWDEAESRLAKAAELYRETGDIHRWGGAALMRTFVLHFRGDLNSCHAIGTELVRAGQDAADPQLASWGYQALGYQGLARGPLDEVAASLDQGRELADKIHAWDNLLYLKSLLCKCRVLQGRLDLALAQATEALDIIHAQNFRIGFDRIEVFTAVATVRVALAESRAGEGDATAAQREALRACRAALRIARSLPLWLPQSLRLQGTACWLGGDRAGAHKAWQESIDCAEQSSFPIERALTWMEIARRGNDSASLDKAVPLFRQAGAKVHLASALHLHAQLLAAAGADAVELRQAFAVAVDALEEAHVDQELASARQALAQWQAAAPA